MISSHIHPKDVQCFVQLMVGATTGITNMVEAVHHTITRQPRPLDAAAPLRTRGITGTQAGERALYEAHRLHQLARRGCNV